MARALPQGLAGMDQNGLATNLKLSEVLRAINVQTGRVNSFIFQSLGHY